MSKFPMTPPRSGRAGLLLLAALLGGCAIQELKQQNTATEARIVEKERKYANLQDAQRRLLVERDKVQLELQNSEIHAAQLRQRLADLSALNEATIASTAQEKAAKARRGEQLAEGQRQAQVIERDKGASREQKLKQLEALKARTQGLLTLLSAP